MNEILTKTVVCGGGCEPKCGECGEQKIIPLTPEEISVYEKMIADTQAAETERIAAEEALVALKASARAKLIAGEPLTEEEAKTIVI